MLDRLCDKLPVENIILYSVPRREGFYMKCGFKKMRTAMAKLNKFMSDPDTGYFNLQKNNIQENKLYTSWACIRRKVVTILA